MTVGSRQSVPAVSTVIQKGTFRLLYLEVVNDSRDSVTFAAYDANGACIIPSQSIMTGGILTYRCDPGAPVSGGMSWVASAPGLVGWYMMA